MWVARNENGKLVLFERKPHRYFLSLDDWGERSIGIWEGERTFDKEDDRDWDDGYLELFHLKGFENLKWEDEPIEIDLVPTMLNATQRKTTEAVGEYFEYVGHVQDIHPYDKQKEQDLYNNMCWRWQDWEAVTSDMPSTWDLNFDDYVGSKR